MEFNSAYLAAIVQSSEDAIISKDLDGTITSWNPAAERLFGYTAREAIGKNIRLIIPDDHLEEEDLIIGKVLKGERINHFETVRQRKDGRLINISITVSPIINENGVIGASKIARDITERIEKEKLIEDIDRRLELALDAAKLGDWTWDADSDLVNLGDTAAKIFDIYPNSEITWTDLQKLIEPSDAQEAVTAVQNAVAQHTHYNIQYRLPIPKGYRWIEAKGYAFYKDDGSPKGMVGVVKDITEAKEREITLEALTKLAPAIASTLDLQKLLQLTTDEATKLTGAAFGAFFYNAIDAEGEAYQLYTLSGAPREAFSKFGMPRATAIFGPTFRGEATILSDNITRDPRYGKSSPHFGMPKGHLPVKSYLAVPVIARNGEVIGGLFFGHPEVSVFTQNDARLAEGIAAQTATAIDNARLYEQIKKEKDSAEEASKAKSEFLANMSHEIRTPMNAIVGLSHILGKSAPLTAKQQQFIDTLQTSASSLLELVNDLLDVSKIEAQSVELEKIHFSVDKIIHEVTAMLSVRAQEKGLKLITIVDSCALQSKHYVGDPTRLKQIITNLCSNAVKFTESGTITVEGSCKSTSDPSQEIFVLSVKDTGIGIESAKVRKIFEKFYQADSSINRKFGGTGLGLTITKTLVETMGGKIYVQSELGTGTTFTFEIPFKKAVVKEQIRAVEEARNNINGHVRDKRINILLVEDHEPNILVAGTLLESFGYAFDVARTGLDAVKAVSGKQYDLVLMDLQMPTMNGLDATTLIRADERRNSKDRIPIIGVTAHAMAGDRERCFQAGMDDYVSKPFDALELREKIESFLLHS